jgi:GNAT superfamily N-acetyltransferase
LHASRVHHTNDVMIQWRYEITKEDPQTIRELVAETGFFYPDEIDVAEELAVERLAKGDTSGYHFVIAEIDGQMAGYASYGHIACTRDSYDLYWIAVHPRHQGQGIGRLILEEAERRIHAASGRRVYIETSNREQYQATRGFYLRCGYTCDAILKDFYGPNDDKVIYVKEA